jgi:hypothetical protein|tara:strand:- start:801 stop:2429 length:1629 start_codon:yes stop_codon:yes gene_type:complete
MTIYSKKKNIKEITLVALIYSVFFIVGIYSYQDFGISVDEWDLRIMGFVNLKYITGIFFPSVSANLDVIFSIPDISNYSSNTHGVILALPTAIIEYFFNITNSHQYYFMRHYINHLIFLLSNFYFFLLVKERFNNWIYGIIGGLFLFLSPRIFAESFYNQKDILFLSLFIISLYYGIRFLRLPTLKNSILFSFTTAISIDIRIMGVIIAPTILFFAYLKFLKNKNFKIFIGSTTYVFLFPLLTILFWPYLWEEPFIRFLEIFKNLSSYQATSYNFYLGEYIKDTNVPWHYILIWIGITTPLFYLALFIFGLINSTLRIKQRIINIKNENNWNDFWKSESELEDLIYYILFFSPILIVILINSTLYNGWRHLYFIYPCLLMISLKGLYILNVSYFKRKKWLSNLLIFLFLSHIVIVMTRDHPHQNVYFNFLAGKNIHNKFEIDYWGLSNKQALEYILENDNKEVIKIGTAGPISLENSKQIFTLAKKKRILVSGNVESDYIIDNYINWYGKYKKRKHKIPNNFKIYREVFVSGNRVISIYKKM